MTTANANTEGQASDLNGMEVEEESRTPTESILTHQEGDEAGDPAEVEAAMAAGWKRAGNDTTSSGRVRPKEETSDEEGEDITDVMLKDSKTQATDANQTGEVKTPAADDQTLTPPEDPEIPGLGKASEVRAQLAELTSLRKAVASTNGHIGHLKQLVSSAGQGKKVTADALKRVSEEFGSEFATALAEDLSTAGFGGGATVDATLIQQMVQEQVERGMQERTRQFEKKTVLRAHPDADEHFATPKLDDKGEPVLENGNPVWVSGPKHADFMRFVGSLPADRQKELQENGWDSSVVNRALDEFKAHVKKAANQQATQTARVNRAVAPTTGSGRRAEQPSEDPMMQGWKNVRGTGPARTASARR
jgi:hypothetical protein